MNEQERQIRIKLKNDFQHYANKCLKIRTKSGTVNPFTMNKAQIFIHAKLEEQKRLTGKIRAICLKGRQQGCSTYVGGRFYHLVSWNKGMQAFILTHALDATQNLYKMAKRFYENTPKVVRPEVTTSNSKELIFGLLDSGYKLGTAENKSVGRSATIQLLHACLSEDSLIVLSNGSIKPIVDIVVGDLVITSSGAIAPVKAKICTGNKLTYTLECWNSGEPIHITANHKVLTLEGYKQLYELKKDDYVSMPAIPYKGIDSYLFKLKNKERSQGGGSKHIEKHSFILNHSFGYFIGYYLAEGHVKENNGYITFTYHKDESFIDYALKGIEGLSTSIKHKFDEGTNRKRTHINGRFLTSAINEICGRVGKKNIPSWMLGCNSQFLDGLVRGYLDGDGSKGKIDQITAPSIHEKISYQIQRLCFRLYGACSLKRFSRKRYDIPTKDIFLLRLCGNSLRKYNNEDIASKIEKSIFIDGIVYCKVKSIKERKIEPVWDIEVDHPDHNYQTTTGIVSNSEVAFWNNAEEHAKGILQAVPNASGTEIIMESTANGIGNYFHQMWQKAEAGQSEYIAIFVPWFWQEEYKKPIDEDFSLNSDEIELKEQYLLTDEQINWRRYKIAEFSVNGTDGDKAFRQEYPCCPNESFQLTGEDSYIQSDLVMRCRKTTTEKYGKLLLGVDPARFGDDRSAIIRRQGRVAFGRESYSKKDTMELTGIVHKIICDEKPFRVFVDVGGLGAGVVDRLKELGHKDIIVAVNAGSSPLDAKKYNNKRSEMWGEMKQWLMQEPCQIPDDDSLHADLCGIRYKIDSNSRLVMEQKAEMKKRGIRSPDEADALALTFALPEHALNNDGKNDDFAVMMARKQRAFSDAKANLYR
jgi:hypothetical protein